MFTGKDDDSGQCNVTRNFDGGDLNEGGMVLSW